MALPMVFVRHSPPLIVTLDVHAQNHVQDVHVTITGCRVERGVPILNVHKKKRKNVELAG